MSSFRRLLTVPVFALAVLSSSALSIPSTASALEGPRPLKETALMIEQQEQVVEKKSETLALTAQELETLEAKKKEVADKLEADKKAIEELKAKIAEKKAREEALAKAAQVAPVAQVASAPAPAVSRGGSGGPNAYGWGQCTWYVKNMRPDIGGYWGNASSWVYSARAAGYSTGSQPVAGAIGSENGGNHVVYVQSVNGNGTVNISEMNYNGGVGQVHYRTTSASEFTYIY